MVAFRIGVSVLLAVLAGTAAAGPLEEAMASAHMKAVAGSDVDGVVSQYADDATLYWIGGPLDGIYKGPAQIREVWTKFVKANDNQPRSATFGKLEQSANANGATLIATAEYGGKIPVKTRHVQVYRDGKLVNEIWQIDPRLQISGNID
jgi:ketosteroid isomerase-like protein